MGRPQAAGPWHVDGVYGDGLYKHRVWPGAETVSMAAIAVFLVHELSR